jgi:GntR family transcriptional regulator
MKTQHTTPKRASDRREWNPGEPLYRQIEREILQCLAEGAWKPGDRLPTETELAERFGVAVFTIRAGISELVSANILVRKQGKGTFVATHGNERQRYQFSRVFDETGAKVYFDRRLIAFRKTAADPATAHALGLPLRPRPAIYAIDCELADRGRPAALMEIAVPAAQFAGLTAKAVRESDENLYAVYQQACGVNVIRIEERVHCVAAGPRAAKLLRIAPAGPALRIERIAYTYNDVPVEFRVRTYDAARYHYGWSDPAR